jgi:uncharacterized protein (TIGR02147 family)
MDPKPNVFSFEDPVDYLIFEFRERQARNARFSLRAWARQIGYENPSYLADVLKKERKLKLDLANKLALNLNLKGKSKRYFEYAVLLQNSKSDVEKSAYKKLLLDLRPKHTEPLTPLSLEVFTLVSEWHHWAILQGISLTDVDGCEDKLFLRLGHLIEKRVFRSAIDRLHQLGLLELGKDGRWKKTFQSKILEPQIPAVAVRNCHAQFMERAREALQEQSREEREYHSTTLAISMAKIESAKKIIQDCHKKLVALAESGAAEEVYQLNTQLFRLTKRKEEVIQ